MRTYLSIATACVAVFGLGGAALAGDEAAKSTDKSAYEAGETMNQKFESTADLAPLADRLVGKSVTNSSGEDIGEIQDLAIGPDRNAYAIVAVDEFLGLGGRDVPVQVGELDMQGEEIILMSQSSKDALKARPEYDETMYKSYNKEKEAAEDTEL